MSSNGVMHANYLSRVVLENVERVAGAENKKAVTDTFFVIMSGLLCAVLRTLPKELKPLRMECRVTGV